jgi:3,4-dihydroxyphenylacetate 2,3-dioxygenase
MGQIVGACFTTHIPRLMIQGEAARLAYMGPNLSTFWDAMARVERERLAALDADTFVIFDTHWFTTTNYVLNAAARLEGVYTSDELPDMFHDYEYGYAGDPELARAIATAAKEKDLRASAADYRGMALHYPTLIPMHYFNADRRRRVLSIGVCQTASVENDLAFGRAVGTAVARSDRKVVLLASGGLSHKFWEYDVILQRAARDPEQISSRENREWDERVLDLFRRGDHAGVLALAPEYRKRSMPEGRFSHYLMMAGALGEGAFTSRGIQYGDYESAIGTGQAIVWFDV